MKGQQQRQRNPKRLPALLPGLAQLSTIKLEAAPLALPPAVGKRSA